MDGHHCQLFNLFDQWILRIGRRLWQLRVGCDMSWRNPCTVVRDSSFVLSVVVLSLAHQIEDLALKSPKVIVNKALLVVVSLKII